MRTLTRIQSPECRMMMLNATGWMSTANKGLWHMNSESPTLSEIFPRVWIIFWPAVYGYGESLHQAHNLIARLLLEAFSIGTQRIDTSVSPTNLQSAQHIRWRYCVDPWTSHNMRKKYWWVKPKYEHLQQKETSRNNSECKTIIDVYCWSKMVPRAVLCHHIKPWGMWQVRLTTNRPSLQDSTLLIRDLKLLLNKHAVE